MVNKNYRRHIAPFNNYLEWVAYDKFLVEMANMRNIDVLVAFPTMRLGPIPSTEVKKFITSWCMKKLTTLKEKQQLIKELNSIPDVTPTERLVLSGLSTKTIELTKEEKTAILASTELYNLVHLSPSTLEKEAAPYMYSLLAAVIPLIVDETADLQFLINNSSLLTGDWLDLASYLSMVQKLTPKDRGILRHGLNESGLINYRISKRV